MFALKEMTGGLYGGKGTSTYCVISQVLGNAKVYFSENLLNVRTLYVNDRNRPFF